MGKKGNFCTINQQCTAWHDGAGMALCLSCKPMDQAAAQGNHYHRGFVMDTELLENVADDEKLISIFTCLSHIEPEPRAIFEDYQFSNISMNTIGKQRGLSRQQVHKIIKRVRIDIKKQMGLSTII
jgi:DNA-directed RNA polymerase specialized sigma24 family protein